MKLMKNTVKLVEHGSEIQLFRLYNEDSSSNSLSETKNLAGDYPEITEQMLTTWIAGWRITAGCLTKTRHTTPATFRTKKTFPKSSDVAPKGPRCRSGVEEKTNPESSTLSCSTHQRQNRRMVSCRTVRVDGNRIDAEAPPV